ncbi:globin [Mangrovibacillus cuniculi]|uniref:Globin n=1 Tax=Mangrovibacillus cuniculi TaxID=2593652 RepID=A0A7S8C9V5_9BACI|nr:globin [Mangrovibacillus cuniculi]QPC46082.1 globin [Mangrovibacillus cuniculi]
MLTPYERIGEEKLIELVDTFYDFVKDDVNLAPLFPDDMGETKRKQTQFLTQYFGGPSLYTNEHGHPMLRARHLPHPITPKLATAWLKCMEKAMDVIDFPLDIREECFARLALTARHMVNTPEEGDVNDE